MSEFKYSVNTNGLRKNYSNQRIVEMIRKLGAEGIEWGLPSYDESAKSIKEMAKLTADSGLEVASYINGPKLWKKDEMRKWAEMVAGVGGKMLRVAHPWIAWDYNESLHLKETWHQIFSLARDSMPEVAALSKETGVRFVLEMHAGALTSSSLSAIKLFEGVDPKYIGVIYDPANAVIEGNMRPRCDVEVLGQYLAYVHAKNIMFAFTGKFHELPVRRARWEYKHTHLPYGAVDYLEIFFALKTCGVSCWISSEEYFQEGTDQYEQLRDGIAFLKECAKHAPSAPQEPFIRFND